MNSHTLLKIAASACGVVGLTLHADALILACLLIGAAPMVSRLRRARSAQGLGPHLLPLTLPTLIHPSILGGQALGMTVWAIFEVVDEELGLHAPD